MGPRWHRVFCSLRRFSSDVAGSFEVPGILLTVLPKVGMSKWHSIDLDNRAHTPWIFDSITSLHG